MLLAAHPKYSPSSSSTGHDSTRALAITWAKQGHEGQGGLAPAGKRRRLGKGRMGESPPRAKAQVREGLLQAALTKAPMLAAQLMGEALHSLPHAHLQGSAHGGPLVQGL